MSARVNIEILKVNTLLKMKSIEDCHRIALFCFLGRGVGVMVFRVI